MPKVKRRMKDDIPETTDYVRGLLEHSIKKRKYEKIDEDQTESDVKDIECGLKAIELRYETIKQVHERVEMDDQDTSALEVKMQEIKNILSSLKMRADHMIEDVEFMKSLIMKLQAQCEDSKTNDTSTSPTN